MTLTGLLDDPPDQLRAFIRDGSYPGPVTSRHLAIFRNSGADRLMSTPRIVGHVRRDRRVDVRTGRPARHRMTERGVGDPGQRPARRAKYLLCGLLLVSVLTAGSLYLARGSDSGASPPEPGTVTERLTNGACGSAVGGTCAGRSIRVSIARVPRAAARTKRPLVVQQTPSVPAPSGHGAPPPVASATGPAGAQPGRPAGQQATPAEQVLALINQARSATGLPPLTITVGLDGSASAHNVMMAGGCGLSHQCPGEPDLGARETAAGVDWTAAGENIGEGGPVADTAAAIAQMAVGLTQDMLSEKPPADGHRKNILSSSFTHIGIAVYHDSSGTVWLTQDFSN
jgi:uncharacterized protein YkwD